MKVSVSEDAFARATKCTRGFICREEGWTPCGRVKTGLDDTLVVEELPDKQGPSCAYHVRYGSDHCCTCPVRIEIHKKFGI